MGCSRGMGPVGVSDMQPEGMKAGAAQRSGLGIWGLLVSGFWRRGDPFGDGVRYSEGIKAGAAQSSALSGGLGGGGVLGILGGVAGVACLFRLVNRLRLARRSFIIQSSWDSRVRGGISCCCGCCFDCGGFGCCWLGCCGWIGRCCCCGCLPGCCWWLCCGGVGCGRGVVACRGFFLKRCLR